MPKDLTPTAYVVLGLVRLAQPCTSYDMKQLVKISIGHFWPFPHSQLYAEPQRLAEEGLLSEETEETGRRRRLYSLTPEGEETFRAAFDPSDDDTPFQVRDEGALRLFFAAGQDADAIRRLATVEGERHQAQLDAYDKQAESIANVADAPQQRVLDLGRRMERTLIDFWADVAEDPPC